uniref:CESA5 n=1 Tax=Arundo donax TaxID=35708 RepID=A0A0A9CLP8_ARUDO
MILIYYKKRMSFLSLATSVLSLFAALVMSTSVRRAHKLALDARPGTSATKAVLEFTGMRKKNVLMTLRVSLLPAQLEDQL